ncbi:hypothetical protein FQZ97_1043640 [compost metagenome]
MVQHAGQVVDDGFVQGGQAGGQAAVVGLATVDAAAHVAFDIVHQVDDLLLAVAHVFQFATDDVFAEQL